MDELRRHPWPGNVRELQSVLKQALVQTNSPILAPESLAPTITPTAAPRRDPADLGRFVEQRLQEGTEDLYAEWLTLTERELFTGVLRHTGWNQVRAAKTLGINRSTLRAKIAALGIAVDRLTSSAKGRSAGSRGGAGRPALSAGDQPVASAEEEQ
jgi:DNA-binding NtrC family response regulator